MLHVARLVHAYVGGSSSPITEALAHRCQDPSDEFQRLFSSLLERLGRLDEELRGRCSVAQFRGPVIGLVLWGRLVARFHEVVDKHKRKHRLVRFATKRSTLSELEMIHRDVDVLLALLGLSEDWSEQWSEDRNQMYRLFAERLTEARKAIYGLSNPQIVEALAIMMHEVKFHGKEMPVTEAKRMRSVFMKVATSSGATVPRIPAIFIPPVDVEVGAPQQVIQGTAAGCVLSRGVWDSETRLVAQYLSVDRQYAKTLFLRSTEQWYGLEHPNVVKMLGLSYLESNQFVVWEDVASCGNFLHYFAGSEDHETHQRRLWRMFLQVAHGLDYIHRQGRAHGNLKCSQILVADGDVAKICHFELSRAGGVDRWKSPEYNLGKGPDPSTAGDVYALGLSVIEARTNEIPYGMDSEDMVLEHLREGERYPRPEGFNDEEWDVIEKLCAHDPLKRPSMAQAIEMVEELAWKEAMEETQINANKTN